MGRTILSATQTWVEEDKALKRFIRALRKSDQELIQELLALSRRHIAEASYASNLYPMDIYLVSMLLETFRRVKQLETRLEALGVDVKNSSTIDAQIPVLPSLISLITPVAESQPHGPEQETAAGIKYVDLQDGV
jgi:aryl-alcohol dehydrogenase-like predicted oxidoreductase